MTAVKHSCSKRFTACPFIFFFPFLHVYAIDFPSPLLHLCIVKQIIKWRKATNLIIMKQLFILFIGMLTAATAVKADVVTRELPVTKAFYSLEVSHEISVILTESAETTIRIAGEEKDANAVVVDQSKDKVRLLSKKGSLKNKVTVFIPVQNLRKLTIKGASYVRSNGNIASNKLLVTFAGEAKVEINNIGDIAFIADENIDLEFQKWNTTQLGKK